MEKVLVCYRGSCTNAAHPCGYNRVTHGLYCVPCMCRIHATDPRVGMFPLLNSVGDVSDGGSYQKGLIVIRPQNDQSNPEVLCPLCNGAVSWPTTERQKPNTFPVQCRNCGTWVHNARGGQ